jgi:hypothetical protein
MAPTASSSVERLDQIMSDLEAVSLDWKGDELQQLTSEAKSVLGKLRNVLKRSLVEQVARLVRANGWTRAAETMKQTLPGANIGVVEEVLALAYVGDTVLKAWRALSTLWINWTSFSYESVHGALRANQVQRSPTAA